MNRSTHWPDQLPELWDYGAAAYDRTAKRIMPQFAIDALDTIALEPGERLLDVAAGTGVLAIEAARRGARVDAIDFAPAMIDQLRSRIDRDGLAGIDAHVMDGQALEFEDATFDITASQFGVNLFPDRAAGFREMHRVLKPGGRTVGVTWSAMHRVEPMFAFLEAMQSAEAGPPPWEGMPPALSLQDPETFIAELEEAGFAQVDVHRVTHEMSAGSAEAFWDELKAFIPTITALVDELGDEQADAVGRTYIEILKERHGAGPLALKCEGLIAVGKKQPANQHVRNQT